MHPLSCSGVNDPTHIIPMKARFGQDSKAFYFSNVQIGMFSGLQSLDSRIWIKILGPCIRGQVLRVIRWVSGGNLHTKQDAFGAQDLQFWKRYSLITVIIKEKVERRRRNVQGRLWGGGVMSLYIWRSAIITGRNFISMKTLSSRRTNENISSMSRVLSNPQGFGKKRNGSVTQPKKGKIIMWLREKSVGRRERERGKGDDYYMGTDL